VYAPFAGRLIVNTSQLPRVGSEVQAGQLLAEVEQVFAASERLQLRATEVQLQTEIDQTRQEVELRQKELDRARQLYEGGAIPQRQLQEAEFNLKQAQAKLQGAERTKTEYDEISTQQSSQRRTPIRAPISGTVFALDLANGQQVDPAKSLLTIVDTSIVWAELAIRETDLAKIRRVTTAQISTPSNPDRIYAGRLENIGSSVDPQNRTVPVIFSVANTDRTLKLEMYVDGRIRSGSPQKTIIVPASAVLSEEGISSVFVETESGVFRRRSVTLGARQGGGIAIAAGLSAGEKVVSTGAQSLNSEALKSLIPAEEGEKR
jgi:cobalt-zinc-cadmium efflux system membrane fusion protein